MNFESHFVPHLAQRLDVARRLVAEMKVVSLVNFASVQPSLQDFVRELVGRHQRQVTREGENERRVNAGRRQ